MKTTTSRTSAVAASAFWTAACLLPAITPPASASPQPRAPARRAPDDRDGAAARIQTLAIAAAGNTALSVTVTPNAEKGYLIFLTGQRADKDSVADLMGRITEALQKAGYTGVAFLDKTKDPDKPKDPAIPVRWLWPLGYLTGDSNLDGKIQLAAIAAALNAQFPVKTGQQPSVTLENANLWLQGPKNDVRKMRAILALLDAPSPQVRLSLWAVQYSGPQKPVYERTRQLQKQVEATQQEVGEIGGALHLTLLKNEKLLLADSLISRLSDEGMDVQLQGSPSLLETLILLGASQSRAALLDEWEMNLPPDTLARAKGQPHPLRHLHELLAPEDAGLRTARLSTDRASIDAFLNNVVAYREFVDALGLYSGAAPDDPRLGGPNLALAPEALARTSIPVNQMLDHLLEAYQADVQALSFDNLLDAAGKGVAGGPRGVALSAQTRMVVTSRRSSSLAAALVQYGEKSTPPVLGADFFNGLVGAAQPTSTPPAATTKSSAATGGGSAASSATGLAALLAGTSGLEAALVQAALATVPKNAFYPIAPGISADITPSMTPDGTSADLYIKAKFGIETNITPDTSETSGAFRPPDSVKSHEVTTVANVNAFNVFDISSFGADSSSPRPAGIFPVLGNLPFIGNVFRWSRGTDRSYHQSVVLVRAAVVPRVLGLLNFYGANYAGVKTTKTLSARKSASMNE
jgi:hypothetical protein